MDNGVPVSSPGILFLVIFTWLIATTIGLSVAALRSPQPPTARWWLQGYVAYSAVLWGGWLIYGLIQAGRLVPGASGASLTEQLDHIAGHFTLYTWLVIVMIISAGTVYAWSALTERRIVAGQALFSMVGGAVIAVIIFIIVSTVNVALVRADIFYKQGQQFDSNADWVGSVELYRRALAVRSSEDHYMLFLGRSLLEQAKRAPAESPLTFPADFTVDAVIGLSAQEVSQMRREDLLRAAETILLEAQRVNPLNTDHTANLARLYRSWADLSGDPETRSTMLEKSLEFYQIATTLSPNAAHLHNEMAGTLVMLGRSEEAEAIYRESLALDNRFETTYLMLAELLDQQGRTEDTLALLQEGLERVPRSTQIPTFLSVAQARSGQLDEALATNLALIERNPNDATAVRNLAILYRDLQEYDEAIRWAERGIELAQNQNTQLGLDMHRLLIEVYNRQGETEKVLPQYEAMQAFAPEDVGILTTLLSLYVQNGRMTDATRVLQNLEALQPDNYVHSLQLAQIYQELGETASARESAQRALSLAPEGEKPSIEQFLATLGG
jgi:tetratricopeptide (TPR) repeat protein